MDLTFSPAYDRNNKEDPKKLSDNALTSHNIDTFRSGEGCIF